VIESWESGEAYDLGCELIGEDELNRQIVDAISADELAACMVWIFRMNDLMDEWYALKGELDD
jgi:hypothetical protein